MSEEIIEPSEIIIEKNGTVRETRLPANPWIRFLARFFDYSLFILFVSMFRYFFKLLPFSSYYDSFIPVIFFAWIPVEALFLSTLGTTPGKFFLKVKISLKRPGKFNYMSAVKRSFDVWFRGLGMGISLIGILCLMVAYHRLKFANTTTWDRDNQTIVTHHPIGQWRIIGAAIVSAIGLIFYFAAPYFS